MKTLASEFTKNGWKYRLVKREGRICIYSQGLTAAWEVFRVRQNPQSEIKGRVIEAHEASPPDSAWGREGFTAHTLERAEEIFATLVQREKDREAAK